mgnify:CR=1 FL=1
MAFGKDFTFSGSQVHYDKLGHDHCVDLPFNRILRATVVVELTVAKPFSSLQLELIIFLNMTYYKFFISFA